jgi:hypothetical protein
MVQLTVHVSTMASACAVGECTAAGTKFVMHTWSEHIQVILLVDPDY